MPPKKNLETLPSASVETPVRQRVHKPRGSRVNPKTEIKETKRKRDLATLGFMEPARKTQKKLGIANVGVRSRARQTLMLAPTQQRSRWSNVDNMFAGDPKRLDLARDQVQFLQTSSGIGFQSNPFDPTSINSRHDLGLIATTLTEQDRENGIESLRRHDEITPQMAPIDQAWRGGGAAGGRGAAAARFPTEVTLAPSAPHRIGLFGMTPGDLTPTNKTEMSLGFCITNPKNDPTDDVLYAQDPLRPHTEERKKHKDGGSVSLTTKELDHRNQDVGVATTVLGFAPREMVLEDKKIYWPQLGPTPLKRALGPSKTKTIEEMKDSVWQDPRLPKPAVTNEPFFSGKMPAGRKRQISQDLESDSLYMLGWRRKET